MATEIDIAVTTTTYNVSITAEPNEYIVNITTGGSGGVQTVTGTTVDNTDPLNPIVEVPNITQVLEQSDREYKAIIDASYTFIPSDGVKYMLNSDGTDLTFDDSDNSFLDKTEFPMKNQIDCTITFVDTDMRSNLGVDVNTPITTASLLKGDDISFKKIGSDPVWFMQVNRYNETPFRIQISQNGSDAPKIIGDSVGLRGATLTPAYIINGEYDIDSDLPIFADVLECYNEGDVIELHTYTTIADTPFGITVLCWCFYVKSPTKIKVFSFDSIGGSPADDLIKSPVLIEMYYKQ